MRAKISLLPFILTLLFAFISNGINAQNNLGARFSAMAGAAASLQDVWSVNANPAGISELKSTKLALNYTQYTFAQELSEQNFVTTHPLGNYSIGVSFNRYGINEYNEIKTGIALARNFGNKLALALKANYHQLKIANYGSSAAFSIDLGATYQFSSAISMGIYTNNPSGQQFKSLNIQAYLPRAIYWGMSYEASDKFLLAASVSRDFNHKTDVRVGADYKLLDVLSLRGGIAAQPFTQSVGLGLHFNKFSSDIAVQSHPQLGYTPQIGISYAF
jgi:long-subunit fatty acid transport protein